MTKIIFFSTILLIASVQLTIAATENDSPFNQTQNDSSCIAELNLFWERLNKTVMEGDFEGNKDCFHKDAVIVFASGTNNISVPIATALEGWRQGFKDTR